MNKGLLFGNRVIAWYSVSVLMRIRDNFSRLGMDLGKVHEEIDGAIDVHVNIGWEAMEE
jgi:hypothetical protein